MSHETLLWIIFAVLVPGALFLDLFIFHRKPQIISMRKALLLSAFWISLALAFNLFIYFWRGHYKALEFLTGFLIEEALSVDNLFVFLTIFSYFSVSPHYQHKVLFWGILGAVVMRGIFIFTGVALIQRLHWFAYVFGAFLIFISIRMALHKGEEIHPERNPILKLFRKLVPITEDYEGARFFVKRIGGLFATPLLVVLLVVETTDIVFAVDSIPAILAITTDPLIVYTSNIFAILGLRALFFTLAGLMRLFHFLHYGLSLILAFVGVKMLISEFYKIPVAYALGTVASILLISVVASILWPQRKPKAA